MQGKIVKDLSANTMQVVINQVLGLLIFYITSKFLAKELFGELNWALATASLVITIISGGLELIIVKKIAQGEDIRKIAGLHIIHVIGMGSITIAIALITYLFASSSYPLLTLLPVILISQVISYFSSPFRQIANGSRLFSKLAIVSVASNVVKLILLIVFLTESSLTTHNLLLIFIIASVAELITALLLLLKGPSYVLLPIFWDKKEYLLLLIEALPQYGVTVFNLVLARFDWILLGLLSTTVITAEYSFAYKAFELTRLPLLIISPILIPLFAKIFKDNHLPASKKRTQLNLLFRSEMVVSLLLPLILISCWSPLMDSITNNKYGSVNEYTFMALSICIPLQFATDFYWNICFARNQLALTLKIVLLSGCINILLNLILIPFYGAMGAAIAYITCFIVQVILFWLHMKRDKTNPDLAVLLKVVGCGVLALIIVRYFIFQPIIAVFSVILLYLFLCVILRIIVPGRIKAVLALLLSQKK